jgi:outer membrane protein OmpA-like peptidoglycan-associated protein
VVATREAQTPVEAVAVDELKHKEQKRKSAAGRSSSLVLVSAAGPMTATATAEPAMATGGGGQSELIMPAIAKPEPKAKVRSGGGGGGGAGGNPPRERMFSQDDLIGVVFGAAILLFLMFYLFRGRADAPVDNRDVSPQFAANEAVVAPPPAPLVDPFGDAPVNLKPTSPIPTPAPVEPEAAIAPAAPVASPPPPPPAPDRTLRAWFCTAQSELTPASRAALEKNLTDFAKSFEGKEVVVMGYADTRGATAYNSWLGGARANVVADFLRTKGIKIAEKEGVGELSGLEDNQNCANQRRVDVWVKGAPGEEPDRTCAPPKEAAELVCN